MRRFIGSLLIGALAISSSAATAKSTSDIDLSRLIVIGDSLSAGFQNGSLLASQQINGYATLLAEQAGTPLPLPLIAAPGIPNVMTLIDPGPPPVVGTLPGLSIGRIDPTQQVMNLAVPGHGVWDVLNNRPDFAFDDLTDLVLGLPGLFAGISLSQVEWAEALQPTTILVWVGSNDVLGAVVTGDAANITPPADFADDYTEMMQRLAATGATLVIANVPDPTILPFLTSALELSEISGIPLEILAAVFGVGPNDFVTPDALPLLLQQVATLPDDVILDSGEVAEIQAAVDAYNAVIAAQASLHGAALVNLNARASYVAARGYVVGGRRITMDYLGGVFSLDGIHLTNTGYAWVANLFIKAMNRNFDADIPPVSMQQVADDDPLIFPSVGQPASSLGAMSEAALEALLAGNGN